MDKISDDTIMVYTAIRIQYRMVIELAVTELVEVSKYGFLFSHPR